MGKVSVNRQQHCTQCGKVLYATEGEAAIEARRIERRERDGISRRAYPSCDGRGFEVTRYEEHIEKPQAEPAPVRRRRYRPPRRQAPPP
jgi:hypothetical protein